MSELTFTKWPSGGPATPDAGDIVVYPKSDGQFYKKDDTGVEDLLVSSAPPSGSAGGSLSGSYPNPTIAAGAITGTEIAAAIKDPIAATAGLRTLGTGAQQAAAGNDSRLSDSRTPTGSAGGDLTGTYPNPTLAAIGAGATTGNATTTVVGQLVYNTKGQVTGATATSLPTTLPPSGSAGGDLTGTYPNPTIAAIGAGATVGNASTTVVGQLIYDTKGRVTGSTALTLPTSLPPSGSAGGSLSGTYPNPSIAAGAIGGTEIAAAIKDPVAATAGLRTLGTGAQQAAAGNDSRLSDARTPTGSAGGDLAGTYPNPTIAAIGAGATVGNASTTVVGQLIYDTKGRVTGGSAFTLPTSLPPSGSAGGSLAGTYPNPTIAAGAIGGTEIAAAIKDPVAATAGLRTLGTGAQQAAAGNDSRLSDSRTPTGSAGGDLTGTYPNPTIGTNKVQNTQFRQGAARSLVGVTGNATANVADIVGGGSGTYVRDSGTTISFSAIQAADLPAASGGAQGAMSAANFTKLGNLVYAEKQIHAVATDDPNNSDWAVNAIASLQADALKAGLTVAGFDDTTEQGRGFELYVPSGATQMRLTIWVRAHTAPGATRTSGSKLYKRLIGASAGGSAVSTWESVTLSDFSFGTNTNWISFSRTVNLTDYTTAMLNNNLYQFEFTRVAPAAGTKLTGNMDFKMIVVEFI